MRRSILAAALAASALIAARAAAAQVGAKAFCLERSTNSMSCTYESLWHCEAARGLDSGRCVPNPDVTTGRGGMEGGSTARPSAPAPGGTSTPDANRPQ